MGSTIEDADALLAGSGFVRLPARVIHVVGEDAASWLNGQLTQDVTPLEVGDCAYGVVTSVKGKIQADTWIHRVSDDAFQLVVPADKQEELLEQFDRHLIMEDAELSSIFGGILLSGSGALPTIAGDFQVHPSQRLATPGWDVLADETQLASAVSALEASGYLEVSEAGFELARLRNGAPRFGIDFDASRYPQEAGLRHAVSFTKGCYVGQEVVCMLENRGRLSRRLVRLRSDTMLEAGLPVSSTDAKIGEITSVTQDRQEVWAFAYIKTAQAEPGTEVRVGDGAVATIESLVGA